jgi:hypothetical protein
LASLSIDSSSFRCLREDLFSRQDCGIVLALPSERDLHRRALGGHDGDTSETDWTRACLLTARIAHSERATANG